MSPPQTTAALLHPYYLVAYLKMATSRGLAIVVGLYNSAPPLKFFHLAQQRAGATLEPFFFWPRASSLSVETKNPVPS